VASNFTVTSPIERIAALPNVEIQTGTEITELEGDKTQGLTFSSEPTPTPNGSPAASASTRAVSSSPGLTATFATNPAARIVMPLETDRAGLIAIGDVRAGSTKRVDAAFGEGAAVVAQIHAYLAGRHEAERRS
jgi:thioredoxin reductase (NADPH)